MDVGKMANMTNTKPHITKDRLNVDIRGLREALQKVAHAEERSLSSAARILLLEALAARGLRLEKPDASFRVSNDDTIHTLVERNFGRLKVAGIKNLKALANGEVLPTKTDFVKIAAALELTETEQKELWQRTFNSLNESDAQERNGHA
ncbi:hypothetical protein HW132_12775 [Brasilonema sp. CT11]|nr:hypothetical protein [Brasilonema sp. CT11]